jgi:hypothetical protein
MNQEAWERFSVLAIVHATCETALERLGGDSNTDSPIVDDLKRILEDTRVELDALAATKR